MRVVLFILTAVWMSLIVHVEGECDQPPVVIDSLPAFECSLLSNDFNIQSLTQAFFPTNRHPALVVEVYYYVNQTVHPQDPKISSNSTADYSYVYRWYASAILGFIRPEVLSALSISTLTVEMSNADIVLASLISDDEDWVRDLLSTATTWLKSYAERRRSSIAGLQTGSQGFSGYKSEHFEDDFILHNAGDVYFVYVPFLMTSLLSLAVVTLVVVSVVIYYKYPKIYKLAVQKKTKEQNFHFKNLFWGFISALMLSLFGLLIYEIYHLFRFGFLLKSILYFLYPLILFCLLISLIVPLFPMRFVVYKANMEKYLIPIPNLLYFPCCLNIDIVADPPQGSCQRKILVSWQGVGVWCIIMSAIFYSYLTCGILLALFVDPIHVISTLAIYVCGVLCGALAFAILFELTDTSQCPAAGTKNCFIFWGIIFTSLLAFIFIVMFGIAYTSIAILFASSRDNLGLISSSGELIPVLVASAITWLIRRELKKYTTEETAGDGESSGTANQGGTALAGAEESLVTANPVFSHADEEPPAADNTHSESNSEV